jgi:hypothetical protein
MTRMLATALLALCLSTSGAFATSVVELVQRNGVFYEKFKDVPFSGEAEQGAWRGALKNRKFDGHWVAYRENATKVEVSSDIYHNNKKA